MRTGGNTKLDSVSADRIELIGSDMAVFRMMARSHAQAISARWPCTIRADSLRGRDLLVEASQN